IVPPMRGKRGGGRHTYYGWSREARDPAFFGSSSTAGRVDEVVSYTVQFPNRRSLRSLRDIF
ncbi:hypothetical protein KIN20_015642, partial [Parelaphostrongylus tenuis]